jgi:MoxR-like ATPase
MAQRVMPLKLVVLNGPLKGNVYPLDLEVWRASELVLGRSQDCHIFVSDTRISKQHSRFFIEEDRWHVEDLGSRNGIFLNGAQVERGALAIGDRLQIGNIAMEVSAESGASAAPPAEPRVPPPAAAATVVAEKPPEKLAEKPAGVPAAEKPAAAVKSAAVSKPPARAPARAAAPLEARGDVKTLIAQVREARDRIRAEMQKVIVGQSQAIDDLLVCLFARGHCLLIGVPGLAKTLMVSTLASVLDLQFKRIQFTPDLMPADITGTDVLEEDPVTRARSYKFLKGPIFTNLLLADEINRTPPKTQAALLEAMQEFRVTASGTTYSFAPPFFVLATQNPIEQEGTYPLPEAQLDRFMFNLLIDYPSRDEEVGILRATTLEGGEDPEPVLGAGDILRLQKLVRRLPVSDFVLYYAADLARGSRPKQPGSPDFVTRYLAWGAGPRAAQYLVLGAKARAILEGRANVSAADVRSVARLVLRHRIFPNFQASSEGITADSLVDRLLSAVPEPRQLQGEKPRGADPPQPL